jgi:hypothetical protein
LGDEREGEVVRWESSVRVKSVDSVWGEERRVKGREAKPVGPPWRETTGVSTE